MKRSKYRAILTILSLLILATPVVAQDQKNNQQDKVKQAQDQGDYQRAAQLYRNYQEAEGYNKWIAQYNNQLINDDYNRAFSAYGNLVKDPNQSSSKYWIGAQCVPAGRVKILAENPQIGQLYRDGGLRVNSVTKDSPAAKAGLKKNDVILAFNQQTTNQICDLTKAIEKAKTNASKMQIIRDGKLKELAIRPKQRPQEKNVEQAKDPLWNRYRLNNNVKYWGGFQPSASVWNVGTALPEDVEVTMRRKGKQSPTIIVQRGDKKWTVKNGKVDELPKDVQAYVGNLWRAAKPGNRLNTNWNYNQAANQFRKYPAQEYWNLSKQEKTPSTAQAISDLTKQVKKLQRAVDDLKKK